MVFSFFGSVRSFPQPRQLGKPVYTRLGSFDVPVDTVSQDPLSVAQSNIPGLVMSAPDVMVGPIETPATSFPWIPILALFVILALSRGK